MSTKRATWNKDGRYHPYNAQHKHHNGPKGHVSRGQPAAHEARHTNSDSRTYEERAQNPHNLPPYLLPQSCLPSLPPIPPNISQRVFTHPDALDGSKQSKLEHSYDRLEFLGDAYLELMSTRLLMARFPDFPAGRLSQQREALVRNSTLAMYARAYGLEERIVVSQWGNLLEGTSKASRQGNNKIVSDVMEAYVAAVIISHPQGEGEGLRIAQEWMCGLWSRTLGAQQQAERAVVDPQSKVKLAQTLVSPGVKLKYDEDGPAEEVLEEGKKWYSMGVYLTGWGHTEFKIGSGQGLSKQDAARRAAAAALKNDLVPGLAKMKKEYDAEKARIRALEEAETKKRKRSPSGDSFQAERGEAASDGADKEGREEGEVE